MSIKNMYNEAKPVLIHDCKFDSSVDNLLDSKMDNMKTDISSTTNIVVTKYADPATDMLDVESSLELGQKGKIIQVELVPSTHLQHIQNKSHLTTLLNKSVIRKISKKKVDHNENKTSSDSDDKKFELCSVCGKELVKNHELFCKPNVEFSESLTSSEPGICSKCGKQFSSAYILKKHISTCRVQSLSSPLCSKCGKHFSSNYNLKRHMTSCKLCPDDEKSPRYMCQCGRTYSQEWDMKKHKVKCKDVKKKCKHCLISSCNLLFYHKSQLIAHMKKDHNVKIQDPEVLNFNCFEDFLSWKEREEEETYTYYSKQTGSNVSGVSVNTYYVCQHDGSDRTHTSTPRKTGRRNKKGRMKTGRICWSQMNVKQFKDGTVKVTYFPSHTHPLSIADTEHHPLPPSVTMEIKRQLSELKADPNDVLTDENQDGKKSRKRQYGMTLRTLRALARKNRSLFRITAEAVQKTDGYKVEMGEEKTNNQFLSKPETQENNIMQLLVTDDENVDDPEEMRYQEDVKQDSASEKRTQAINDSFEHLNELKSILHSDKLDISVINNIKETLNILIAKCKSSQEEFSILPSRKGTELQDVLMYNPQSPLPGPDIFPLENEVGISNSEGINEVKKMVASPEKTVYQIIAVDSEEKQNNEYLYQNAVELVGAREFIIIAGDHAQYFQSIDSDVQYDLS